MCMKKAIQGHLDQNPNLEKLEIGNGNVNTSWLLLHVGGGGGGGGGGSRHFVF